MSSERKQSFVLVRPVGPATTTAASAEKTVDTKIDRPKVDVQNPSGLEAKRPLAPLSAVRRDGRFGARGRRRLGTRRGRAMGSVPHVPPSLEAVVTCSHTFRFRATQTVSLTALTYSNLVGITGGVCTVANSTVVCMASSIRVRQIKIWPASQSFGTSSTCEVVWYNPGTVAAKDEGKINLQPDNVLSAATVIVSRPPRLGTVGLWLNAGTVGGVSATIAELTASEGSIIDVDISWTLSNNFGGVAITGFATATLSTIYYMALDGRSNHLLVPVGLPTTF